MIRVVVAGRPNVGKSSYINALLDEERLVVSPTPGTTRDAVEIPFRIGNAADGRRYLLVDTAGMRKRGKARTAVEKFSLLRTEASIRRSEVVILMIDAVEGPHRQDKKVGCMITRWGKGGLILVNKWDLADGVSQSEYEQGLRRCLPFLSHLPVVFVSALRGRNIDVSLEALDFVAAQLDARVGTGMLNRVLQAAVEQHRPVFRDGRPFRLYYAAQTGTRPPQFTLFVNRVKGFPKTYEAYLINCLRRAFGFEGVAIRLRLCPHRPTQKSAG
ncbi:MAG TPA: GTP-binding protein [Kiritimatiellae bacterium]|nr:GTP-binding protein [Kiritimatiellia bacterium]